MSKKHVEKYFYSLWVLRWEDSNRPRNIFPFKIKQVHEKTTSAKSRIQRSLCGPEAARYSCKGSKRHPNPRSAAGPVVGRRKCHVRGRGHHCAARRAFGVEQLQLEEKQTAELGPV